MALCTQVHHVTVRGGPGGYEAFINDIRRIFGITAEHDMQLAFDCADPVTGAHIMCNPVARVSGLVKVHVCGYGVAICL